MKLESTTADASLLASLPSPDDGFKGLPLVRTDSGKNAGAFTESEQDNLSATAAPHNKQRSISPPIITARTAQACDKCRERKTKCSGERPTCTRCFGRGLICHYTPRARRSKSAHKPYTVSPTTKPPRKASCSGSSASGESKYSPVGTSIDLDSPGEPHQLPAYSGREYSSARFSDTPNGYRPYPVQSHESRGYVPQLDPYSYSSPEDIPYYRDNDQVNHGLPQSYPPQTFPSQSYPPQTSQSFTTRPRQDNFDYPSHQRTSGPASSVAYACGQEHAPSIRTGPRSNSEWSSHYEGPSYGASSMAQMQTSATCYPDIGFANDPGSFSVGNVVTNSEDFNNPNYLENWQGNQYNSSSPLMDNIAGFYSDGPAPFRSIPRMDFSTSFSQNRCYPSYTPSSPGNLHFTYQYSASIGG